MLEDGLQQRFVEVDGATCGDTFGELIRVLSKAVCDTPPSAPPHILQVVQSLLVFALRLGWPIDHVLDATLDTYQARDDALSVGRMANVASGAGGVGGAGGAGGGDQIIEREEDVHYAVGDGEGGSIPTQLFAIPPHPGHRPPIPTRYPHQSTVCDWKQKTPSPPAPALHTS